MKITIVVFYLNYFEGNIFLYVIPIFSALLSVSLTLVLPSPKNLLSILKY